MKRVILIAAFLASQLAVFTAFQPSATAGTKSIVLDPRYGKPLSYRKLMMLTPAKRDAYIASVRKLVVEVEKMQHEKLNRFADAGEVERMNQYVEMMNLFLREFESAALADQGRTPYLGQRTKADDSIAHCPAPFAKIRIGSNRGDGDLGNYVCVVADQVAPKTPQDAWKYTPKAYKTCLPGTTAINETADGMHLCATNESFNKAESKESLTAPNPAAHQEPKKPTVAPKTAAKPSGEPKPKPKQPSAAETALPAGDAAPSVTVMVDTPDDALVCKGEGKDAKLEPLPADSKFCNADTVKAAREKYYSGNPKDCLYAGNFSEYMSHKAGRGRCEPSSRFCLGDHPNCLDEKGERIPDSVATYKCDSDRQQICNPLVFGLQVDHDMDFSDNKPFCVDAKADATEACSNLVKDSFHPANMKLNPFVYTPGIMEAWDHFVVSFNKMCDGSTAAHQFNCKECQFIRERLVDANMAAIGADDCGQLRPFDAARYADRKEFQSKHDVHAPAGRLDLIVKDDVVGVTVPSGAPAQTADPAPAVK